MNPDETGRDDVAAAITELQNLLLATRSVEEFLQEVAVLAAARVANGLSCAITLQPNGRPLTVAASDVLAGQVDEAQYDLDQGPCLSAMRTGEMVRIDDTAGDARWGGFAMRAAANGIRSCLSLPLAADGITGALNLYAPVPRASGQLRPAGRRPLPRTPPALSRWPPGRPPMLPRPSRCARHWPLAR